MATLPTVTITDDQQARILDAFKVRFGTTTPTETIKAYKKWLVQEIRTIVLYQEASKLNVSHSVTMRDALSVIEAALPNPDTAT